MRARTDGRALVQGGAERAPGDRRSGPDPVLTLGGLVQCPLTRTVNLASRDCPSVQLTLPLPLHDDPCRTILKLRRWRLYWMSKDRSDEHARAKRGKLHYREPSKSAVLNTLASMFQEHRSGRWGPKASFVATTEYTPREPAVRLAESARHWFPCHSYSFPCEACHTLGFSPGTTRSWASTRLRRGSGGATLAVRHPFNPTLSALH